MPVNRNPDGTSEAIVLKKPEKSGFPENNKMRVPAPRRVSSPVKAYTANVERMRAPQLQWEVPEWDLAEAGRIIDCESYARRAFEVREALFMKEGYEFTGANPERVTYIKKRLTQMQRASGVPFDILMLWTISALERTSNAFWVKVRDKKTSGGGIRTNAEGKKLLPVAAYFSMQPETVRFKRDAYGKLEKYRQVIRGKEPVEFDPEDVIHFYFNKREGFSVGTPTLASVKDDIRALRQIEENLESLVYIHLFPLYHYKVGTPEMPAQTYPDGTTEVDDVKSEIENMPTDGCWVTPERHEISVKGAEGESLDVKEIIAHFKQRIFTGLGVSSIDMGEGGTASRSTAQTLSRNLIDRTKAEQRVLEAFINTEVVMELLLESTFEEDKLFEEENVVRLKFKEIDNATNQAQENHVAQMYMQHLFSHDEARDVINREPWTEEDWQKSYWKQIDEPTKLMQSIDEPYSLESRALVRANTSSIQKADVQAATAKQEQVSAKEQAAKKPQAAIKPSTLKAGANRNRPANQHGTRPSAKLNKDFYDAYDKIPSLNEIFTQKPPIGYLFSTLKEDVSSSIRQTGWDAKRAETAIGTAFEESKRRLIEQAKRAYRIGINDTNMFYWEVSLSATDMKIERHVARYVDKLRDNIFRELNRNVIGSYDIRNTDAVVAKFAMESLEHRAEMIDQSEIMRAYNAGLADGFKAQGVESIELFCTSSQPCEICKHSSLQWGPSDAIIYEELAPLHPYCECVLRRKQS